MTKFEVLMDITRLYGDIDQHIWSIVEAKQSKDKEAIATCQPESERLLIAAQQELSFLRDYIEENVKE